MGDEFNSAADRKAKFPTMAAYCRSRDRAGLVDLICDPSHQRNVFGTYNGTTRGHAVLIVMAAERLGRRYEMGPTQITGTLEFTDPETAARVIERVSLMVEMPTEEN